MRDWLKEIDIYSTHERAVKMLVANKIDCEGTRVVSKDQGRQFAREHAMLYIETSAKTNQGVQQAFEELVLKIMDEPSLLSEGKKDSEVKVEDNSGSGYSSYCMNC